jgi:hypothetical protein
MTRIRFDFGTLTLDAELLDTPTSRAIAEALPMSSSALTWGEEVYFEVPVKAAREVGARAVVTPGEIAYWPDGHSVVVRHCDHSRLCKSALGGGVNGFTYDDEATAKISDNFHPTAISRLRRIPGGPRDARRSKTVNYRSSLAGVGMVTEAGYKGVTCGTEFVTVVTARPT